MNYQPDWDPKFIIGGAETVHFVSPSGPPQSSIWFLRLDDRSTSGAM